MKVKIVFSVLLAVLMLVSVSQIFSIPPYAGDIFPLYKSGYFKELDREFGIIKDSFLGIKSMARPEYAWIFLSDICIANDMSITVYDYRGYRVPAPGEKSGQPDREVLAAVNATRPVALSDTDGGRYVSIVPVVSRGECKFCHPASNRRSVIGAFRFERRYDATVYYTSERIIIFVCITILLGLLLYALLRWDPGKNIKELFDK
jgi:hypothetical protein